MAAPRSVTFLSVLLLLGAATWVWRTPLRVLALTAAGKSPACPLSQALKSEQNRRELTAAKDRILSASRLSQKDREHGLELWST
ncbi:MAG TPA: hypothetical protein VG672_17570, partial [Bryobacteraceae bacterium]|nr:hypothetical protein [Bryobacteraceae bacterium]